MLSIVIPLFNEEQNVDYLCQRLESASNLWKMEYEIIFVDDGSWDFTLDKLRKRSILNPRFKILKLSRNFGHQAAISAGLKYAKGKVVSIMDGDLQDPPEELHRFLDKWREGYHVIYAIRKKRKESLLKRISYKLFYRLLAYMSNIDIPLDSGDFCVMDRKVVNVLNKEMIEVQRFVRGLRAYAGFRQIGVTYERDFRNAGEVKYTFRKLFSLAINGLLDFSTFPLRFATYVGFSIAFPSFVMGFYLIIQRIFNFELFNYSPTDTPGIATLAVAVFFLCGLIMVLLGVIGEYIGRLYIEVKRRPFFIVEEYIVNPYEL